MALTKKPYRGCRDFFPADMRVREYLFASMKESAEKFGFEPYDGPLLEEVELYKAKSGEELINDQIYSFMDRGERQVAIRPEMTPTLARMIATINKQTAKPIRWYSIPNLMRYEKPQRGRVREHWQFNVDIFGAPENLGELEVLSLIVNFLTSLGANSKMFSIKVNDRKIVDQLFKTILQLDNDHCYKLYKVIDKSKKVDEPTLKKMLHETLEDESKVEIMQEYLELFSWQSLSTFCEKYKIEAQEFLALTEHFDSLALDEYLEYDPAIVRGLDYYTGLVFEIFDEHPDNNRAIAGGGAYANLLQIFNEEPLTGIGFGLGDVTLRDFLESHQLLPDLNHAQNDLYLTTTEEALEIELLKLGNELRKRGLRVESSLHKIKFNKIFKQAEAKGHQRVAIVENKDGTTQVQIKNLATRKLEFFPISQHSEIENFINEDKA